MANVANPLPYITKREYGILPDLKAKLFESRLSAAKNLFRKDLTCHFGCVNAIEFSINGELLLSGGDDRRVMVWQFGQAIMDRGKPEAMKTVHQSNIFCLGITNDQKKIYSGGNDDMVIVHDLESKSPLEVLNHQRAVCSLSIDPYNDQVVATAGNDGRLLLFDTRQSVHESLVISRSRKAFHGVMFHPLQQGILASANARDGVALWDLKSPKHPVIHYTGNQGTSQNCMSVRFNSAGTHILALRRRLAPVLYTAHSAQPVAEFYHQDYYNSCTMKSCSFAGESDKYVLSGSDDFNLYLWKVPDSGADVDTVVEAPHIVLNGHRSIVNQVRYNPHYSLIASSGVEKIIKLWSTMEYPSMSGELLSENSGADNPREIYSHDEYMALVHHGAQLPNLMNNRDQSTTEDPRMMAFFDSLVQRDLACLEDSDSCDADATSSGTLIQLSSSDDESNVMINFMPTVLPTKRAIFITSNGNRNQRCPNRLSQLGATRYPKNSRSQKRGSVRRTKHLDRRALLTKFKVLPPTRASVKGKRASNVSRRGPGAAPRAFPRRRAAAAPPPRRAAPSSGRSDSDADADADEPQRPPYRPEGRNLRPLRRRMNLSRAAKRKNKSTNYRKTLMNLRSSTMSQDSDTATNFSNMDDNDEANMALPSTSTGYRGQSSAALFRIAEADSDDDHSVETIAPRVSPLDPKRPVGFMAHDQPGDSMDSMGESLIVEPPESENSTSPPESRHRMNLRRGRRNGRAQPTSDSSESPLPKDQESASGSVEQPAQGYNNSTVERLMNETNESELESSSSEGSLWGYPNSMVSPITVPGNSSRPPERVPDENPDDPEWQAYNLRQMVSRVRRSYRHQLDYGY